MSSTYYAPGFDRLGRAKFAMGFSSNEVEQARCRGLLWQEVSVEPASDLPASKCGYLVSVPARRTWRHMDTDETHVEIVPGYYRSAPDAPEGADICLYCGSDTTGIRLGFDCGFCGGN